MKNRTKALIYILLSTLSFCLMSATVKYLKHVPVYEKVFYRNLVSLVMALYIIHKSGIRKPSDIFGQKGHKRYLLLRSLLGLAGVVLNFYAISNLMLADSQILMRLSPVWVAVLALVFLREKLTRVQVVSAIIALVGAVLVVKPAFNFNLLPALAGVAASVAAGSAYTVVRYLSDKEKPATIIFYFSVLSVGALLPPVFLYSGLPDMKDLLLLILTGLFASGGQFGLTHAYKYSKASEVSIYTNTGIVFSAVLGFLIWGEIPDIYSGVGGVLIIGSAWMVYRWRKE